MLEVEIGETQALQLGTRQHGPFAAHQPLHEAVVLFDDVDEFFRCHANTPQVETISPPPAWAH